MMKVILIAALLATGGSSVAAQSLIGKWDCEGRKDRGTAFRTLMTYRTTGAFYHLMNVAVGDKRGQLDASAMLRGSWKLQGERLIEKITTVRMRSLDLNGQDVSRTPVGKALAKTLPEQLGVGKRASITRVQFTSPTRFKLTSGKTKGVCIKR